MLCCVNTTGDLESSFSTMRSLSGGLKNPTDHHIDVMMKTWCDAPAAEETAALPVVSLAVSWGGFHMCLEMFGADLEV